jgi:hypothetical protein
MKGKTMSIDNDIKTELKVVSLELDRKQDLIDHARKTYPGKFWFVKSYLNREQLKLDVQRLRVDAAIEYMDNCP